MNPARTVARNEWYDALKERDRTLWLACKSREREIAEEQRSLPTKERLTAGQKADIIDAMSGIKEDTGYFKRMEDVQRDIVRKRGESRKRNAAAKKAEKSEPQRSVPPLMVDAGMGEKSPGGELPPSGDLGVVGNPTDILWAVEYLGSETTTREDAPSGTAWTLLCAGRKSPDTLLRIYQGVCVPSKKELEDAADETDAYDHLDDVLKRVIEIAEGAVG